ncbi:MAG TPA: hypothetical protein VM933_01430, partial [Acidimicrobiales bacterium]|nr:hypothetical protein [Acidimicrobiales bacterium]
DDKDMPGDDCNPCVDDKDMPGDDCNPCVDDKDMPGDDCNPCVDDKDMPGDDCNPKFSCPVDMTERDNGDGVKDIEDCVKDVKGLTIVGPTTPSSVEELLPAAVQGVQLERLPEELRSTEVQGVQVGAPAPAPAPAPAVQAAPLARTGSSNSTGILVLLAAFLLALGAALVRVGGRRPAAATGF